EVGASVTALSNGNYVVSTPLWNSGRGAATWASGTAGIVGTISSSNSLVGTSLGDGVGDNVTALKNGNYVVSSPGWNNDRGAATWASGTTGITGTISAANSLVGSNPAGTTPGDEVGSEIAPLPNNNYVVLSPGWNGKRGAATFGSGTAGVTGAV